jgi:GNAT superfamily N-acetyltransferase
MIRNLNGGDYEKWRTLWQEYLAFYRTELAEDTTIETFGRLVSGSENLVGLVAQDEEGRLIGFAHLVFHASTWASGPYCYLEDLFVDRTTRGTPTARDLILATYGEADRRGAVRTYWQTQEFNAAARSLYDRVGRPTSFVIYER